MCPFGVLGVFVTFSVALFNLPGGLPTGHFVWSSFVGFWLDFTFTFTFFFVLSFTWVFEFCIRLTLDVSERGMLLSVLGFSLATFSLSPRPFLFALCWSFAIL